MWINDKSVTFQIDSGATVNVLLQTYVSKDDIFTHLISHCVCGIRPREGHWQNGCNVGHLGQSNDLLLAIRSNRRKLYSSSGPGRHAAEKTKLITINYNSFKLLLQVTTTNMLSADVFGGGLETLPGKAYLHVEEGAKPV